VPGLGDIDGGLRTAFLDLHVLIPAEGPRVVTPPCARVFVSSSREVLVESCVARHGQSQEIYVDGNP